MANETKKFLVPVSWTISAMVEIEAEDEVEANDFAFGMDLDTIEGADYVPDSFDVDFGMIEEVQSMKAGDSVKILSGSYQGVVKEIIPADGIWGETAIVSLSNGEEVEYELTDLEVQ